MFTSSSFQWAELLDSSSPPPLHQQDRAAVKCDGPAVSPFYSPPSDPMWHALSCFTRSKLASHFTLICTASSQGKCCCLLQLWRDTNTLKDTNNLLTQHTHQTKRPFFQSQGKFDLLLGVFFFFFLWSQLISTSCGIFYLFFFCFLSPGSQILNLSD